ncbi:MAG TPA: acyl-CoA dehydrogenase [Mycobacteriales bacterium]
MSLAITDDHRELERVARAALTRVDARGQARALLDAGEEAVGSLWDAIVDLDWLGLHLPVEYGGSGFGLPELVVVVQELGRAGAPGPFVPTVAASAVLDAVGSEQMRKEHLPALADGSRRAAVGTGRGLALSGDGTLVGGLTAALGAGLADLLVLLVGEDVVVVDARADGLTLTAATNLDPTRRSAGLRADGVVVAPDQVVPGGAARARAVFRTILAADACGGAQECVDRAVDYARQREQFGRVIGAFQAVKHHCADMLVASERATAAVWDAARAAGGGDADQFALTAATALVEAVPAALRNAQLAIQVHGGIGFTWENDSHLFLRRAGALAGLADVAAAARDVTGLVRSGVKRSYGLDLPPEAEAVREEVRAVAERFAAMSEADRTPALVDSGYSQPHWPRPWGRAAGAVEQLVIDEEFARAGVSRPQLGITAWNILSVVQHGTADQIERWVRRTLTGELVWCQLFSEPDAGSDAAGIRTRAERVDGGFLVNGQKVWTSGAQYSHLGLATVRTDPSAPKHEGITTVVIDMHATGVEVRPLREATGASMFNEVFFQDVFVPDADVVGPVNGGWKVARSTLGNERVSIGGGSVVPLALDLASIEVDEPDARGAGEKVGAYLAEEAAIRAINLRAAARAVAGGEPGPEGNVTKLLSAEHMQRGADLALELLGPSVTTLQGAGFLVGQVLLFSRAMTIAGGTSEITRNQIGERILGLPRDPLVS